MTTQELLKQYQGHTFNVNKLGLHGKRIGNNIIDVFSGDGFSTPTRLRLIKGQWLHISGPKLSAGEQLAVVTAMS